MPMKKGIWVIIVATAFAVGMMVQTIPADATHSRGNDANSIVPPWAQNIQQDIADIISGVTPIAETDPEVGSLVSGNWCISDGTVVNCDQPTPADNDSDPTNEIQELSLVGRELSLSKGGGTVEIPPQIDDPEIVSTSCAGSFSCTATCFFGQRIVGGGYEFGRGIIAIPDIQRNAPDGENAWTVELIPGGVFPPDSKVVGICTKP